jgi:hypothetical protein
LWREPTFNGRPLSTPGNSMDLWSSAILFCTAAPKPRRAAADKRNSIDDRLRLNPSHPECKRQPCHGSWSTLASQELDGLNGNQLWGRMLLLDCVLLAYPELATSNDPIVGWDPLCASGSSGALELASDYSRRFAALIHTVKLG